MEILPVNPPKPQLLATGGEWDFYKVGESVYFTKKGVFNPNDETINARYECSYDDWKKYRPFYTWIKDVKHES